MKTVKYEDVVERGNLTELRGNLTMPPEVVRFANGGTKTILHMAVSMPVQRENQPEGEEVAYVSVDYKGDHAKDVLRFLDKGTPVFVSGALQQDRWDKGGKKGQKAFLVGFDVHEVAYEKARKELSGFPHVVSMEELKEAGKYTNKVSLVANLTADPEIRFTPAGTPVANLRVARNRSWSDDQGKEQSAVSYFTVEQFGDKVKDLEGLRKGDPVHVDGKLHMDQWQTKEEPPRIRYDLKIRAFEVQKVSYGRKNENQQDEDQSVGGVDSWDDLQQDRLDEAERETRGQRPRTQTSNTNPARTSVPDQNADKRREALPQRGVNSQRESAPTTRYSRDVSKPTAAPRPARKYQQQEANQEAETEDQSVAH